MEFSEEASKSGFYDVYYTSENKKLIVLDGLDLHQQIDSSPMQLFIQEHYTTFETFYWILWFVVMLYMALQYVIYPLFLDFKEKYQNRHT